MIRPFTCVCFVLACGSGLYLYQAKHRVQLIDREIEKAVRVTEELRDQARVLHAEWTLQNDPQRLQALAEQLLSLKTVAPGQFTSIADLGSRLPPVPPPDLPPPAEPPPVVIAQGPLSQDAAPAHQAPVTPTPAVQLPKPPVVAVAAPPPRPVEHRPPPRPVVAEAPPVRQVVVVRRPAAPETPARQVTAAGPFIPAATGSALGMARGASVPPPQPMPVSASQWVANGGGG